MHAHDFAPAPSAYLHTIHVQPGDIDELGHANNVVWVRWVNEAAIAHATHVNLGGDVCRALGVVWVVRRHDIEYLLPAYAGQALEVLTWPETLRGASCVRRTLVRCAGQVLARAETTWVLVDAQTGKPRRATKEMLAGYGFSP